MPKEVIRSRKLENNDLQRLSTTNIKENHGVTQVQSEGLSVPSTFVLPVVLLLNEMNII